MWWLTLTLYNRYASEDVNVLPHVAAVLLAQLPLHSQVVKSGVRRPRKRTPGTLIAPVKRQVTP